MHKTQRGLLLAICFALMTGCHQATHENLFNFQSNDVGITTSILETMLNDENLSNLTIHVSTTNGVVTLTGYVKTIRQSDTAEEVARKTPGVTSVQNDIVVRK